MSRISEVISWFESRALVKILGGGNLHSVRVSARPNDFQVAEHVRKAVNAVARHGYLLKVGSEERHDACARLFTLARARKTDLGVERSELGLVLFDTVEAFSLDDCRGTNRDYFKLHNTEFNELRSTSRKMSCCHADGEPNSTPRKHAIDNSIRVLPRASAGRIQGGPW